MLHHLRHVRARNPGVAHPVIKKIAEVFRDAPDMSGDARVLRAFDAYQEHSAKIFRLIEIPVLFVDYDPYPDAETMRQRVVSERRMEITTIGSDHPLLTPEDNVKGRAVHDLLAHIVCGCPFDGHGEFNAYEAQAALYPISTRPLLFSEIVAQACYFLTYGSFLDRQKIVFLPRALEREARVLRRSFPKGLGLAAMVEQGFMDEEVIQVALETGYDLRYQYAVLEQQNKRSVEMAEERVAQNPYRADVVAPRWAQWIR